MFRKNNRGLQSSKSYTKELSSKLKSSPHRTREQINVLQTGVIHWQLQEALGLMGDDLGIRPLFHEMILAAFKM